MSARIIQKNRKAFRKLKVDSVTIDIIESALRNARFEMDTVLFRTAMSPGIREQGDAFPLIADHTGKMIVGQFGSFIDGFLRGFDGTLEDGDMIFLSDPYSCEGAISHEDNLGNEGRTEAGDVQVMSAGTGIAHAEYNREDVTTRIFQIWIEPRLKGGAPSWGAKPFPRDDRSGRFVTLASGIEGDDALPIRANARVAAATVNAGEHVSYDLEDGRHAYLVAAKGRIRVNGEEADPRDGIALRDIGTITVEALDDAELVLVDSL